MGTIWHPALCIHSNICALWQSAISQSNSSLLTRKCLGIKKSFCSDILFCVYHHHITLSSGTCIGGHSITTWTKRGGWRVSRKSPSRDKGYMVCKIRLCKMSIFVHSRGLGVKICKNLVHVVVECPLGEKMEKNALVVKRQEK